MTKNANPTVVFIDDEQETLRPLADRVKATGINGCTVDSPTDIDEDTLALADLVVVDYTLNKWINEVDVDDLSLRPLNGVALASVLREHSRKLKESAPTGFALITGRPNTVSMTPGEQRPHVVARLSNLEWFFEKQAEAEDSARRIASLATAIHQLPAELGNHPTTINQLMNILGVDGETLVDRYRHAVERCRPPIHHLSQESGGIILLRWLLHRILPHTCFLFNHTHLAARLRVTSNSLQDQLEQDAGFCTQLARFLYAGPLKDFDGPQWWRGGIEQWLWEITDGNSANSDAIVKAIVNLGADRISRVSLVRPVVTLNADLMYEEEFCAHEDAEAVHLDDWPSYAEPAYMRKDLVNENEQLRIFRVHQAG